MPFLDKNAIGRLATKLGISLNVTTKQSLFIVPSGQSAVITSIVVRNVSAAAITADAGFGADAGATDFRSAVQFDGLAAAGDGVIVEPFHGGSASPVPGTIKTYAAGGDLGIKVGTVAAVTVDVDVFGYMI